MPDTHPARLNCDLTPPFGRDPWAWVSATSVLPLVIHSLGAPLGEPVAEDFDFLRHVLLLGQHSLAGGGGSNAFWRPLAHQLYYLAFGPLILAHPRVVATIHAALLTTCALLLYRLLRRAWTGPWAAAAASFPLLAESTRTLISWPSHFVDLGSLLFAIIALHEASRRRMVTSQLSLLASLLCKETGVVAAAMIPLMPGTGQAGLRTRWALATATVTALWAVAYFLVRDHAGLALPHNLEKGLWTLEVSPAVRLGWALQNSVRAIVSLPAARVPWEGAYGLAWFALGLSVLACYSTSSRARARLQRARPWVIWGVGWFILASAAIGVVYPMWAPNRSVLGAVGLGVAVVALAGAAHPGLLVAIVALRIVGFALSPGPSRHIAVEPPQTGAFMDFERLVRLQRLMADIRGTLRARFPTLPPGSRVGQNFLPPGTTYALGGSHALQVWYRDSTLRWVTFDEYSSDPDVQTIVQFQPHQSSPMVALVDPPAMQALLRGNARIARKQWSGAVDEFATAESLQSDPRAGVFLGTIASRRALCLKMLGDRKGAVREALRALAVSRYYFDARYVLANEAFEGGRLSEARTRLDTLLRVAPGDSNALNLLEQVRKAQTRSP